MVPSRKIMLSFILTAAIGVAEIFGIAVCGNMLPDYKNLIFEENSKDSVRLMFINDEDSLRFYPWLEYDKKKCLSYDKYMNDISDKILKLFYYGEIDDQSTNVENKMYAEFDDYITSNFPKSDSESEMVKSDVESACKLFCSEKKNELNETVRFINNTFDNERCAPDNTDFIGCASIDNSTNMLYIEDFEYTDKNKKNYIMDLILCLNDYKVVFYNLKEKTDNVFSSFEITEKSTELISDLDYAFDFLEENFESLCYGEKDVQTYDGEEEVQTDGTKNSNEYFDANTDILNGDYIKNNILLNYISNIKNSGIRAEICCSENNFAGVRFYRDYSEIPEDHTMQNLFDSGMPYFTVEIPFYSKEYNIFSDGDELIMVLNGDTREESTILYYCLSCGRITGISFGKVG